MPGMIKVKRFHLERQRVVPRPRMGPTDASRTGTLPTPPLPPREDRQFSTADSCLKHAATLPPTPSPTIFPPTAQSAPSHPPLHRLAGYTK